MISRRFLVGALAAIPAASVLARVAPARASGIGEKPGDLAVGDPDAPVTVIEFFSLTCPSCERFHKNVYNRLKPDYVDTGTVRFIARDFPLNAPALQAAVLAHCAGPDRYYTFIDVLFQTFDDWGGFGGLHRQTRADRRTRRREPGPVRGLPRGHGPREQDFPVDCGWSGRIRRKRNPDSRRQRREVRRQDDLRCTRQTHRPPPGVVDGAHGLAGNEAQGSRASSPSSSRRSCSSSPA